MPPVASHVLDARCQHRIRRERAVGDRVVDDDDALRDDAAAADVDVADLAVAHHARRQSDGFAAGLERGVRIAFEHALPVRQSRRGDRVAVASRRAAPAVEDREHERRRARAHREAPPARAAISAANDVRVEARAADEPAVDVRLRDEGADVVGIHAAAVEDARVASSPATAPRICAMTSFALRGVVGEPGADRPDRLVGDDAARDVFAARRRRRRRAICVDARARARVRRHGRRADLADRDDRRDARARSAAWTLRLTAASVSP